MAGQIRISPEQMNSRASEYRTQADNVGGVISTMDSLLQSLQGEWEGAASDAYAARFAELRPSFVKAQELINEIASALDATAQALLDTDTGIASQFRG